jgi:hypothetical protein
LQYHHAERLGWVPWGSRPFLERDLALVTRRQTVRQAVGATVFLIVRLPRPTGYFLWESFTLSHVEELKGQYLAWGTGQQMIPPLRLEGPEFEAFQRACAYFVGFQAIDRQPYLHTLREATERNPQHLTPESLAFCSQVIDRFPTWGDAYYHRAFVHHHLGNPAAAQRDAAEALRLGTDYAEAARCWLGPLRGSNDALVATADAGR